MRPQSLVLLAAAACCAFAADTAPVSGKAWSVPLPDSGSIQMSWIEPGSFTMGSPATEAGRHEDEAQFQVTLTHGYWMGATELTVAQWRRVMGDDLRGHLTKVIKDDTLYDFDGKKQTIRDFMRLSLDGDIGRFLANEDEGMPMYYASWNDAMEFAAKLTELERKAGRLPAGYKYTLPTEAQWERACRAGNADATYAPVLTDIAWYSVNAGEGYTGKPMGRNGGPRLAGLKKPNAWGLFDMAGNLWEWCLDWYGPYPTWSVSDPTGPATGVKRVDRGGSFGSGASAERSANRASNPPAEASAYRGFRIALTYGK